MTNIRIQVEVTTRCNHNCLYCPRHIIPETRTWGDITPEMSDLLISRISEIDDEYNPLFSISGFGETTLYPKLMDFIYEIKSVKKSRIRLNTNASSLHKIGHEIISSQLIDLMGLSLNLPTEELHKKYTRTNDFAIVSRNIIDFLEEKGNRKPASEVRLIKIPESMPYLEESTEYWKQHLNKNDRVSLSKLLNWGGLVGEHLQKPRNNSCRYQRDLAGKHLSINKEGYASVCCFGIAVNHTHPFIIGNIKEHSINDLLMMAKKRAPELIGSSVCENCNNDMT